MINSIIIQAHPYFLPLILEKMKLNYPRVDITVVNDLPALIAVPFSTLQKSRLISFGHANIVPRKILSLLGWGAYNFHPGPPSRPGSGSVELALYDQDKFFGTVLHVMDQYVDSGPIVAFNLFPIPANCIHQDLRNLAYQNLFNLLKLNLKELITNKSGLTQLPIVWGLKKFTNADCAAYSIISEDIEKSELELRIRAFQASNRSPIQLHMNGTVFVLTDDVSSKNHIKIHGYSFEEVVPSL